MRQTLELWAEPSLARHDEANDPHLVMGRSDLQTRYSIRVASRIGHAAAHNAGVRVKLVVDTAARTLRLA